MKYSDPFLDQFVRNLKPFSALWLTLFGESRGEPIEGIIGVGCVIRNRVNATGLSYVKVCVQGLTPAKHQFSCWNEDDPNLKIIQQNAMNNIDPICREIRFIAEGIMDDFLIDNTHGANHYLTTKLYKENPPSWARTGFRVELGHQTFISCA